MCNSFWHESNGLLEKSICYSILSLPLWTPEADGIHPRTSQPPLPALAHTPLQRTSLSGGQNRKGREALTPAKKQATAPLSQETAKAERKPLQVSVPGVSMFMRIPRI